MPSPLQDLQCIIMSFNSYTNSLGYYFIQQKFTNQLFCARTLFQMLEMWLNPAGQFPAFMELYSSVCMCWRGEAEHKQ